MATIAVIFDYDDTIMPDSTTALLKHNRIDTENFWTKDFKKLVQSGWNPTLAYLKLILDNIGINKPLGEMTNAKLREFGESLESTQYPGLEELIYEIRETVRKAHRDIDVEFYIISSGLEEVINGNSFVKNNFTEVYGSTLCGDEEDSILKYIKNAVTFTEKTKYIFEISKGITKEESKRNPLAVNQKKKVKRIPLKNMIYVGDGYTDIPCFSLLEQNHGQGFGVFHNDKTESDKIRYFKEILKSDRVLSSGLPRYGKDDSLGSLIPYCISAMCAFIIADMDRQTN